MAVRAPALEDTARRRTAALLSGREAVEPITAAMFKCTLVYLVPPPLRVFGVHTGSSEQNQEMRANLASTVESARFRGGRVSHLRVNLRVRALERLRLAQHEQRGLPESFEYG